jgi:hypothetical protein
MSNILERSRDGNQLEKDIVEAATAATDLSAEKRDEKKSTGRQRDSSGSESECLMRCGKTCYKDRREALKDAVSLRKRLGPAKPYYCEDCDAWHLTTNTIRKRYKIKRRG